MSKNTLIKLYQSDCNPCTMVENFLQDSSVQYKSFNVEENPEVAAKYSVMGVPVTILLDEDEKEITRSIGFKPAELESLIEQL